MTNRKHEGRHGRNRAKTQSRAPRWAQLPQRHGSAATPTDINPPPAGYRPLDHMKSSVLSVLPAALVAVAMLALQAHHAQGAAFQGLGDLSGGTFSSKAYDVSADGSTIVGMGRSDSGYQAFRWTVDMGMGGIDGMGYANAVSADGTVAVGGRYRYTLGEGLVTLPHYMDFKMPFSYATDVSADGSVVVGGSGNSMVGEGPVPYAVRWPAEGGVFTLGAGGYGSVAYGVSADGSTIVGSAGSSYAFRWTAATGRQSLGDLPGGGSDEKAFGVSGDGSVVVGWGDGPGGMEAFRWTAATGMVGLGVLPGDQTSWAEGITADASIVWGSSESASGQEHAFIWDETNGMRSVQDMLTDDYGFDLTGWSLSITEGISDDGKVVVGYGLNPSGNTEAWMAVLYPSLTCVAASNWNDPATWDDGIVTPSGDYDTVVENRTVTVAADGAAASLSIKDAGSVVIGAGSTLTVAHDVEVAAGTILDIAGNLNAGSLNAAGGVIVAENAVVSLVNHLALGSPLDMTAATLTTRAGVTRINVNLGGGLTVDDVLVGAELNVASSVRAPGVEAGLVNVHDGGTLTTGWVTADSFQLAGDIVNVGTVSVVSRLTLDSPLDMTAATLTTRAGVTRINVNLGGGLTVDDVLAGAELNVAGSVQTPGVEVSSVNVHNGGTLTTGWVAADSFQLAGDIVNVGTVSVVSSLTLDSPLAMTGGTLTTSPAVTRINVNSGGVLTVDDALTGVELNVAGSVQTPGVEVGSVNVHSGGTLTTGGMTADSIQLAGGIVNTGGATAATLGVSNGSLTASGPVTADVVNISGGALHLIDGADLNAATLLEVSNGSLTASGPVTADVVNISGGALHLIDGADLNAATLLEVSNGSLTASGPVTADVVNVSGGAVRLIDGANLNVATMTVSGAAVNTGTGHVAVSNSLMLGSIPYAISSGHTFRISGAALDSAYAERTVTLTGGVLSIGDPSGGGEPASTLAHWSFDTGYNPDTGSMTMTESGVNSIETVDVKFGAGALDTSASSYVATNEFGLGGSFSVAVWVKPRDIRTNYTGYINKKEGFGGRTFWVGQHMYDGEIRFGNYFNGSSETPLDSHTVAPEADMVNGVWYHVVAVWDEVSQTQTMYLDGEAIAQQERPGASQQVTRSPMRIGSGGQGPFDGLLDEVWLFDSALDQGQVRTLMSGNVASLVPAPLDLPTTNVVVSAESALQLATDEDAVLGDLTLGPGAALTITGALATSFGDVAAGEGSSIHGNISVRGTLSSAGSGAGTFRVHGELELPDGAEAVIGAGDALTADKVNVAGGGIQLGDGANLNVGAMDVTGGEGAAVNTGTGQVVVSDTLVLDGLRFHIEDGNTFQANGVDLRNSALARTLTLTGGMLSIESPADGGYSASTLGHWSFDAGFDPDAGSMIMTETGVNSIETVDVKFGAGALDTSASSYVVTNEFGLGGSFSVAFWAKPRDVTADGMGYVGKTVGGSGRTFWVAQDSVDGEMVFVNCFDGAMGFGINSSHVAPQADMVNGVWYHVVAVWDEVSQTQTMYLDGQVVAELGRPGQNQLVTNSSMGIGGGLGRHFDGLLDEVWLFDSALTPELVRRLMSSNEDSLPPAPPDLSATNLVVTAESTLVLPTREPPTLEDAVLGNLTLEHGAALTITGAPAISFGNVTANGDSSIHNDILVRGTFSSAGSGAGTFRVHGELDLPEGAEAVIGAGCALTADKVNVRGSRIQLGDGANLNVGVMGVTGQGAVVNTGAGQVIVSDTLVLDDLRLHIDDGNTFQANGADLQDADVARTLTLTGGVLSIGVSSDGDGSASALAHWSFDAGFDPDTGSMTMSETGVNSIETVDVKFGAGALDTSASSYVATDEFDLGGSFSVALWVKPRDVNGDWKAYVSKNGGFRNKTFRIGQHSSDGEIGFGNYFDGRNETPLASHTTAPEADMVNGVWYHVVAVWDEAGQTQTMYLDGEVVAEQGQPGKNQLVTDAPMRIGGSGRGSSHFDGLLDEVWLFDSALTPLQVRALMSSNVDNLELDLPTTNLVVNAASTLDLGGASSAAFGAVDLGTGNTLTVSAGAAVPLTLDGLSGAGTIDGDISSVTVSNVAPGNSVGTVTVEADVALPDDSTFGADVMGTTCDTLASTGTVTLGANVSLDVIPTGGGNEWRAGTYVLINAAEGLDGTFANVTAMPGYVTGNGLTYDAAGGTVTLTLELNLNPGDGNLDGATDVLDRIIWNSNNFTSGTTFVIGDFNNDGATDVLDRIVWNSNNFTSATAGPPGAIAADAAPGPLAEPKFIYNFTTGVMRVEANGHFLTEIVIEGNEGVSLLDMIPFQNTRGGFILWTAQNFNGKFQAYDAASNGDSGDFVLAEFATGLDENDFIDGVNWGSVPELGQPGESGFAEVSIIPEPATLALLLVGGGLTLLRRRNR